MPNPSNATQGAGRKKTKILESSLAQYSASAQSPEVITSLLPQKKQQKQTPLQTVANNLRFSLSSQCVGGVV